MSFNVLSCCLVYTLYPETARKTLEEIDSHFGKINLHSPNEGTIDELKGEVTMENEEVIGKRV